MTKAGPGPNEGQLLSSQSPLSDFCCIECKNIANNVFHLGPAIKSGKFGRTLALKGPAKVLSWSKLVIFLDLETTDELEFTAWFEVNLTFGTIGISIYEICGVNLPPPPD